MKTNMRMSQPQDGLSMSGKRWIVGIRKRLVLLCLCVALLVMASACFRDTAETIQEQPVAREVASAHGRRYTGTASDRDR